MKYPGRIIKKGDTDKKVVTAIQKQLNAKDCGPLKADGDFGPKTLSAVKLFQARNADSKGNPLVTDGEIGAITWGILFSEKQVPHADVATSPLLKKALEIANTQIGVTEDAPHQNRGAKVDEYIKSAGLNPGNYAWCAAFAYWCFNEASANLNMANPVYRTPGVLNHWNKTKGKKLLAADAIADPSKIKPGFIFIMDFGKGNGHTGIVESVNGGYLTTIEGNTNNNNSREGYGVFKLTKRKVNSINKGFIDYA